jgi:hypothetical protein
MIARTWFGAIPLEKLDASLELLRTIGCGDYRKVSGNLGALQHRMDR